MQKKGKKPVSASLDAVRHSLAHLLAAVVLKKFPTAKLGVGPTIENGFYYDFLLPRPIANEELGQLEEEMRKLIRQNLRFRGRKVSAAEAKKLMRGQPFKLELIRDFTKEKRQLSVYDIATPDGGKVLFLDLCRGGHVHSTQEIHPDAFRLTKTAGAYWKGSERNPQLQRIYGVAFATKRELTAYLKLQEELEKRDHRKLGARLDLFSFHSVAPGAPFWHGNGMILFKELEAFIRSELDKAGYQEI
ncbi:threonine--tRNA ligase, partial [Candidatus Parcubacteria bacterium]